MRRLARMYRQAFSRFVRSRDFGVPEVFADAIIAKIGGILLESPDSFGLHDYPAAVAQYDSDGMFGPAHREPTDSEIEHQCSVKHLVEQEHGLRAVKPLEPAQNVCEPDMETRLRVAAEVLREAKAAA